MEHHHHNHARAHELLHKGRVVHENMAEFGKPSVTLLEGRSPVRLVPRASCTNDSDPGCTKPTQTPTLAIALAVIVPIVLAAGVLFYLHRRHIRKLKQEDKDDKYKSLDFGMDEAGQRKKKKGAPEMIITDAEKSIRGHRGTSLDMNSIASPYIMPAGLHGSRESFHSMSRSAHDPHDPYGPVAFLKDTESIRSGRTNTFRNDNASVYTGSSGGSGRNRMGDGLLKNAQTMSQSFPPRGQSMSPQESVSEIQFPQPAVVPQSNLGRSVDGPLPPPPPPPVATQPGTGYGAFKPMDPPSPPNAPQELPAVEVSKSTTPPPRVQSQEAFVQNPNTQSFISDSSYGEGLKVTPPSPRHQNRARSESGPVPFAPEPVRPQQGLGLGVEDFNQNTNRLSMSIRPLPNQGDDPNEDPEQRANRIRSFYKEYFDDSKPEPVGQPTYDAYYEDYGSEYLDGAVFDPQTGSFIVARSAAPYAEPVTRRAMTPPPRAPPRFRSGTMTGPGPRGGHMSGGSSASSARFNPPPRGMSSMSGRIPPPRKPMPPPSVLNSLPTPAMLKEDSMMINPIDFAPPISYRERQNGARPDSPLGAPRPYSPAVRPHTPLASAFEELPVMPSPHLLRKSGTFTALDFAPPPRFRDPGSNASDAGSIRSNRSGISTTGRMAIRNGAYRVSKIPKEMVGTRDDITTSLRPQMSLVAPA